MVTFKAVIITKFAKNSTSTTNTHIALTYFDHNCRNSFGFYFFLFNFYAFHTLLTKIKKKNKNSQPQHTNKSSSSPRFWDWHFLTLHFDVYVRYVHMYRRMTITKYLKIVIKKIEISLFINSTSIICFKIVNLSHPFNKFLKKRNVINQEIILMQIKYWP